MLKFYIAFTIASLITLILSLKNLKRIHEVLSKKEKLPKFGTYIVLSILRCTIPIYHIYISFMNIVLYSFDDKQMEDFLELCKEDSNEV